MSKDTPIRNVLIFLLFFIVSGALVAPLYVQKLMGATVPAEITSGYLQLIWYLEVATDSDLFYILNTLVAAVLYGVVHGITQRLINKDNEPTH